MSKFLVGDRVIAPCIHPRAVWVVSHVTGDCGPISYRLRPHCGTAQCNEHRAHGMHFTAEELEYAPGYALPPIQGAPIRPDLYREEREAIASARSQHQATLNASLAAIRAKHEAEQKVATFFCAGTTTGSVPVDSVAHAMELLAQAKADKLAKAKRAKQEAKQQAALTATLEAIRLQREAEQKAATERRDALTRYTNLALATTEALKQVKELEGFGGKPTPTPILATFAKELQALVGEFQYHVVTFNGLGVVARKEK